MRKGEETREQQDEFTYRIKKGEEVTIVFTPVGVGPFVEVAVDGTALQKTGADTPTFSFKATKEPGKSHFGHGRCDFPGAPASAKYTSRLRGSLGGDFAGPTIRASDPDGEFDLVWDVVA